MTTIDLELYPQHEDSSITTESVTHVEQAIIINGIPTPVTVITHLYQGKIVSLQFVIPGGESYENLVILCREDWLHMKSKIIDIEGKFYRLGDLHVINEAQFVSLSA